MPVNTHIRGLRQGIQGGFVLGRTGRGRGAVTAIPIPANLDISGANATQTAGGMTPQAFVTGSFVNFNSTGAWSSSAAYNPGDVVTYNGGAYVNYVAVSSPGPNTSPDMDDTHWLSQGSVNTVGAGLTLTAGQASVALGHITNSLGSDVLLNNIANYFDGPSVAQGTSGIWFASGTVTVVDLAGFSRFDVKLWDGTTIFSSASGVNSGAGFEMPISISGVISNPAGNIRISAKDVTGTNGKILFNSSGNSLDSTLTAIRIG